MKISKFKQKSVYDDNKSEGNQQNPHQGDDQLESQLQDIKKKVNESYDQRHREGKKSIFEDSMNMNNILSIQNGLEQVSLKESQQYNNSDSPSQNLYAQNKLQKMIQNIKLKFLCLRMLSRTQSRMFKNMNLKQFKQIDDKAYQANYKKINNSNFKKTKLMLKNINKTNMKRSESGLKERFNINIFSTCSAFVKLNILNNALDSTLNFLDKNYPVLIPSSFVKIIWDIIQILMIILYMFEIPLYITFNTHQNTYSLYLLICSVPIFIFMDTLISLNTGIYEKGILIKKRAALIKINLTKVIVPNFIIIFCYCAYIIPSINNFEETTQVEFRYKTILLLPFFYKLSGLGYALNKFEEIAMMSKKQKNMIALINLLFKIVFIAHIISCIWIMVAQYEEIIGVKKTWLKTDSYKTSDSGKLYINAYYFATVTMITVGFGDYLPVTDLEKTISVIFMIFSCGVFAYSMNTIGSILQNFNEDEIKISQNLAIINSYMHKKNINKSTQSAIREYLEYYWREERDRNQESEEKIINILSDNLKEIIQFESKNVVFRQSTIFKNNFSEIVRQKMVPLIKEHRATPDEIICAEDIDDDCSIYFIEKGSVEIFIDVSQNSTNIQFKQVASIEQGQSFGELSFFSGKSRIMNIKSKEFTTLLIVKREEFVELIKNYPEDYERFCTIQDSLNLYNNLSLLNVKCLSCEQVGHLMKYCPQIHFIPNELKLRQIFMVSPKQERRQLNRNLNLKYNSILKQSEVRYHALNIRYYLQIDLQSYDNSIEDSEFLDCNDDDDNDNINSMFTIKNLNNYTSLVHNPNQENRGGNNSPLPQKQSTSHYKNDRNNFNSHTLIDENNGSIVMDDALFSKSPLYSNQKNSLFQKDISDKNKAINATHHEEDIEPEDAVSLKKDFEDQRNINKGYQSSSKKLIKLNEMNKQAKNNNPIQESSNSQNQSNYTKMISMKPNNKNIQGIQKLNNIFNQIMYLFANTNSTNNNKELQSPISAKLKSPFAKKQFPLLSELEKKQSTVSFSNNIKSLDAKSSGFKPFYKQTTNPTDNLPLFIYDFDCQKSYTIYYPLNNLENQLDLMSLSIEKKRQKMIRSHFDNMAEIKKLKTQRDNRKRKLSNHSIYSRTSRNITANFQNEINLLAEDKDSKKSHFFQSVENGQGDNFQPLQSSLFNKEKSGGITKCSSIVKLSQAKSKYVSTKRVSLNNSNACDSLDKSNIQDFDIVSNQDMSIATFQKQFMNNQGSPESLAQLSKIPKIESKERTNSQKQEYEKSQLSEFKQNNIKQSSSPSNNIERRMNLSIHTNRQTSIPCTQQQQNNDLQLNKNNNSIDKYNSCNVDSDLQSSSSQQQVLHEINILSHAQPFFLQYNQNSIEP